MARRTTLPTPDEEDVEEVTSTETGESYEPFCQTDLQSIPEKEQSLYRRVSTVLSKAGITSPSALQAMPFSARRRIKGLGGNGLDLIEETFATGEPERIALLFQPQEGRLASRKYGASLIPGISSGLYHRLQENGIADVATLRSKTDLHLLRETKGIGRNAIAKIREAGYTSPGLSEDVLSMILQNPRKADGTIVRELVAEVRRARGSTPSTNGVSHDDDDEDDD